MGRYKTLIGPRPRGRGFAARQSVAAIGVAVLNRMLAACRPDSVRCQPAIASSLGIKAISGLGQAECTNADHSATVH
jgi:hypothetical protein